jgi:glycosyltransferase involved in cell wall biosynthesis
LNIGGPTIHTILLTTGLGKDRFKSILVTGKEEDREGDMLYLAQEKDVQPIIIPELSRKLNFHNDIIAFWKLFHLIKKEKPDIIHTHTAKAGALGRLAGLLYNLSSVFQLLSRGRKRCIVIHTFHGHVLHSYFGKFKSRVFVWIEKILAIFTDQIIAVSESLRKELITLKIADPNKIITIPLGLELEKYLKLASNDFREKQDRSIGIIGRLVPVKNHKMFLQVVKKIKDTVENSKKIKFFIVGDGPLRSELESYARKLGINESVIFSGWIKDLEKIYAQLDIVALTSLNEGTPVALIEAQAAARPCVATNVGGVANVIEEKRSGILVSSQNIERFAQAIIDLLNKPDLMNIMGKHGRNMVREKFAKKRLLNDIENLYSKMFNVDK